jgi:hypothetical protein
MNADDDVTSATKRLCTRILLRVLDERVLEEYVVRILSCVYR